MLLSFLNKDPISVAQQTGTSNNFAGSSMHMISSDTNSNNKWDKIPSRKCILPIIDKIKPRVNIIEQMCNRPLTGDEKEQLNDINQLFRPDPMYSPMLTRDHLILLSKFEILSFPLN
jgi:hypothetical protein